MRITVHKSLGMAIVVLAASSLIADDKPVKGKQIKGKPEHVVDKIVAGKVQAFCNEFCLLCQKFIKDNTLTVAQYLQTRSKQTNKSLSIRRFWRWKVGS